MLPREQTDQNHATLMNDYETSRASDIVCTRETESVSMAQWPRLTTREPREELNLVQFPRV